MQRRVLESHACSMLITEPWAISEKYRERNPERARHLCFGSPCSGQVVRAPKKDKVCNRLHLHICRVVEIFALINYGAVDWLPFPQHLVSGTLHELLAALSAALL